MQRHVAASTGGAGLDDEEGLKSGNLKQDERADPFPAIADQYNHLRRRCRNLTDPLAARRKEHETAATLNSSKKFPRETLTVSGLGCFDISRHSGYALDDFLRYCLESDVFFGDKNDGGLFGQCAENNSARSKVKNSF